VQVVAVERASGPCIVEPGKGAPPRLEAGEVIEERPPGGAPNPLLVRGRGDRDADEVAGERGCLFTC
jgi:hypothetical protein